MYNSNRNNEYLANPRKTDCPNIVEFIKETCTFYYGCDTIAQEAYDKYVRYCSDRGLKYGVFNTFARSFKYYILHQNMVNGVGLHPVNYMAYKDGVGYINKSGWAYSNLNINY